jgi:hypothetical protein
MEMKFNLTWDKHFVMSIFSMCGGGKSYLLQYILTKGAATKQFDHLLLFANTGFNGQYDYIPKEFVHSNYDENILQQYMIIQKNAIAAGKNSRGVIVFDDVLGDACFGSKTFLNLITQYRQYKLSVIICSQSISKIPCHIRDLSQYSCIFRFESKRAIENAYESFGVLFNDINEYKQHLIKSTGDHKFLFYDKMKSTQGKEEAYKCIMAPKIPQMKLKY